MFVIISNFPCDSLHNAFKSCWTLLICFLSQEVLIVNFSWMLIYVSPLIGYQEALIAMKSPFLSRFRFIEFSHLIYGKGL